MGYSGIYPLVIAWALTVVALIALRVIGFAHGNHLPFFYISSRQSRGLSPERLHRYRALRSYGLSIGLLTILVGYVITFAADAGVAVTTIFYCVGISMVLSSGLYLEYCMAMGRFSPPVPDPSRASKLF